MKIIPLIHIQQGILRETDKGKELSYDEVVSHIKEDTVLYVLDVDGIQNNKPNLSLYKRLSNHCLLWIDTGPRSLDDVVDVVMAGASTITIRKNIWPSVDLFALHDLTEDEIFFVFDQEHTTKHIELSVFPDIVGAVVFYDEKQIRKNFSYSAYLKEIAKKSKLFIYNVDPTNMEYWKEQDITGVLVDIKRMNGYTNNG